MLKNQLMKRKLVVDLNVVANHRKQNIFNKKILSNEYDRKVFPEFRIEMWG